MGNDDRETPTSDELIVSARGQLVGRRGSVSAAMAEAARSELATADVRHGVSAIEPDGGESTPAPDAPPEIVEPPRSESRVRGRTRSPQRIEQRRTAIATAPRPVPASPAETPRTPRRRARRVVALVIAGFVVVSVVSSNFDRVRNFAEEQLDRAASSGSDEDQPATDASTDTVGTVTDPVGPHEVVNLALERPVVGSGVYRDESAGRAVDGNLRSAWNAGGYPPQWLRIDLGTSSTIHSVRLLTGQSPEGVTIHQVVGWGPNTKEQVLHEFDGFTKDNQWLSVVLDEPISGIQNVAIVTVNSPSWVAWFEIEVNGHSD